MKPLFPKWMNALPTVFAVGSFAFLVLIVVGTWYYAWPEYSRVGYEPIQPVAFSHQVHAGMLGMDCRYCHTNVEKSRHANVPTTTTCMNCHTIADDKSGYLIKATTVDGVNASAHWKSKDLQTLRTAHAEGRSLPWRKVHKLPDYVLFNHSVHVNAGVSCFSCHQRIDQMPVVRQAESLAMGWCLDCHRNPQAGLIDRQQVLFTDLQQVELTLKTPDYAATIGKRLAERLRTEPPQHCGACHY